MDIGRRNNYTCWKGYAVWKTEKDKMSINNDGWKEDPPKSHSLFYKLYMTGRVWVFNNYGAGIYSLLSKSNFSTMMQYYYPV